MKQPKDREDGKGKVIRRNAFKGKIAWVKNINLKLFKQVKTQ